MKYPIKMLLDKDRKPFIPFVNTAAIVEDGTGKTLKELLEDITVPIVAIADLSNTIVNDMMTSMYDYKDVGFAVIYAGNLYTYSTKSNVDTLNTKYTFIATSQPKQSILDITGYYNVKTYVFTTSSATVTSGTDEFVTKQYVDTQIGDINAVLAKLTTPEEVS